LRADQKNMAPAKAESPSQTDTPMTDANDDAIPSIPVDAPMVREPSFSFPICAAMSHHPLDCGVYSARTQRTIADVSPFVQAYTDTPDYTVMTSLNRVQPIYSLWTDIPPQDSDTNPNTTASSVAGDAVADGHRRRSEATQLRKSILSKKHGRLDESKVRSPMLALFFTP
jgi:SWI/SNF-related matrix-associated actin-dependent regulator of chromatin subfamily A member 5